MSSSDEVTAEATEEEQEVTALPTIDEANANISQRSRVSDFELDGYKANPQSLYKTYHLRIDHAANDRATEFKLCQVARPHMRAFHCAWCSFFLAFMLWFCPAPLLAEIQTTLGSLQTRYVDVFHLQ